ncbi:MAG: malto-oligosyltrehalose synthase [Gammaproteobacteria bacterium]|nr:malto-oligosyltrehalose synthase [Gammaproteobacteria bacterium]
MNDPGLLALCRLCGIQPRYYDIWGNRHDTEPDVIQAFVVAMGIDLTRTSVDAAIAQLQAASWHRRLAPVQVVRTTDSGPQRAAIVRLAQEETTQRFLYTLTIENGDQQRGEVHPTDLTVVERATIDDHERVAYALPIPELPLGYHRLEIQTGGQSETMVLIVAPDACYVPTAVADGGRIWGAAIQLYALRSSRNWGIGDFTDLGAAVENLAGQGAAVIGLNPLHALYPHNPQHVSPYSPSSRLFVNVLYLDVEGIAEFAQCATAQQMVYAGEFQQRLQQLRAQAFVDYPAVAAVKFPVLERLYQHFRDHHLARNTVRAQAFRKFQTQGGEWLYRHTLYEALQEHFYRQDSQRWGWPVWPEEYRTPDAPAVARFAERERVRIEYFQYLQWQADQQLGSIGRRAYEHDMGVGLYQDLAVSIDRGGAEAWAWQSLYARQISIGAPPDELALLGQNWGLPPLVPQRLREAAYAPFIATLRANMRHGGALRIDHVMGLMRLFWVPEGRTAKDGAYVEYPFRDMLGILALESHRNRCLVIGEDLGTVPDEVRATLAPMNVLSYRLFYFERNDQGDFKPPATYPERALATVSTHDLPTLAGWWKGQDLFERERLNLFPSAEKREQQILQRAQDRARLLIALQREGLLPEGATVDPASSPEMTPQLARAVHEYLARSPSKVVMLQLEDVIGELCQANLPGTVDEHPNWCRKLALDIEPLINDAPARALFEVLRRSRGPGGAARPTTRPRNYGGAIPTATYRLQFHKDFTFRDAERLAPYLQRLGVSHCYASPYLKARPGSRHGYDIVDHNALNPEIGSETDYDAFIAALRTHRLGQVLDIVPNHMGIGSDNQWWLDVLENGPASLYAAFFDIDWYPLKPELHGKVLLPVLGDHYGEVIERGELTLAADFASGAFEVRYYNHRFPLDPETYPLVLERELDRLATALAVPDHPRLLEYQSLMAAFRHLPGREEHQQERLSERQRDKEMHKKRLAELCAAEATVRGHIERIVGMYNGDSGRLEWLHELLEQQAYRLAYWRVASDEINYRRFFDINDLAALRMENPQTFYSTHRLISDLVAQGKVNGLRIDHPDGLYDPLNYYQRLQSFVTQAAKAAGIEAASEDGLYVIAEKILASHEYLPEDWPIHGTTGYEFVNLVNGVFVHPDAEEELDRIYTRFIGRVVDFDQLLAESKRLIMRLSLSSELNVLAYHLNRLSESDWHARDFTLNALRYTLREVVASFPVYRTYIRGDHVSPEDRRYIEWAISQAKKRSAEADVSVFDFVWRILLLEGMEQMPESHRHGAIDFTRRFQQYTAPVMAKGLEDTAFYAYHRFVALNEVGGDPRRFGVSMAAFHRANIDRARRYPHSMLATSTHDTKRSEDVRARLDVISEVPGEWRAAVTRWGRINRGKKRKIEDGVVPDRNDEYLLYQTLVGAWPLAELDADGLDVFRQRIEAYAVKAVKEAKVHTSWINPNLAYEEAMQQFVRELLAAGQNLFLQDFLPFVRRLVPCGLYNSLSQVLFKLTAPGVPDFYQGNELWDFSLVDPDNRRPVDYVRRDRLLADLEEQLQVADAARVRALLDTLADGRAKLYLTWRVLNYRRTHASLYRQGEYVPLAVDGARAEHLGVFVRRQASEMVMTVASRWLMGLQADTMPPLGQIWADTWIEAPAEGAYLNLLTGEIINSERRGAQYWLPAALVLANFPVALLEWRK